VCRNTRPQTATHCNTLQHICNFSFCNCTSCFDMCVAIHGHKLQRTATLCNTYATSLFVIVRLVLTCVSHLRHVGALLLPPSKFGDVRRWASAHVCGKCVRCVHCVVCCSVLQCVAVCGRVLQCVAVCRVVLHV